VKKYLEIIAVAFVVLLFSACRKEEQPSYQIEPVAKTMLNVSYGNDPEQKMDVYLPANRTSNTGVIIFVHGGSFIGGDKNEYSSLVKYFVDRGYAVLNVNYRLVVSNGLKNLPLPTHLESPIKVKDQVSDISTIVDFAIINAHNWVVSNSRIGIAGHSAGATLALLYSYDARNTKKIKAVSNIAASLDLTFTDLPNWQFLPPSILESGYRYTGFAVDPANEQHYKDISPLYVANTNKLVPTLTIFPENNTSIGLPKQDITVFNAFTTKLIELKIPNQFLLIPGADHTLSKANDWLLALNKTFIFFNENIK
jgi:acetyl esterase/lipase